MSNDPWYTRSEFWGSFATHLAGLAMTFLPGVAPTIQTIGAGLGMLAPIVYTFGRSNVKAAQAAAAMTAVAGAISQPK
jgi:hypothetical protein